MTDVAATGLTKSYGALVALSDVSFSLAGGRVCALAGPNGAGKSTLIAVMLGLKRPCAGSATFGGRRYVDLPRPIEAVGAVIDGTGLHPDRSAQDHLRVVSRAAQLPDARVHEVLADTGLSDIAGRPAGALSLGMRQRLRLACALLGRPQVLVLDEPTNGLDPQGRQWFRELLTGFASRGGVALISTHQLAEAELLAHEAMILSEGRLVAHESIDVLTGGGVVEIKARGAVEFADALTRLGYTAGASGDTAAIADVEPDAIGQLILDHGIVVEAMTSRRETLQDVVLRLTAADGTTSHELTRAASGRNERARR